jgi:hypothetical protein
MVAQRNQSRRSTTRPKQPAESVESKALEFGNTTRRLGWRLAWCVASCCEPNTAGRPSKIGSREPNSKVSMNEFASIAGVSRVTVQRYFKAWELASREGQGQGIPAADTLKPTDTEMPEAIEDDEAIEGLGHSWSYYYEFARTGKPPQSDDLQPDDELEEDTEPTDLAPAATPKAKTPTEKQLVEEAKQELLEDEEQRAETVASQRYNAFTSCLESVRVLTDKLDDLQQYDTIGPEEIEILTQISDLALDLSGKANALKAYQDLKK